MARVACLSAVRAGLCRQPPLVLVASAATTRRSLATLVGPPVAPQRTQRRQHKRCFGVAATPAAVADQSKALGQFEFPPTSTCSSLKDALEGETPAISVVFVAGEGEALKPKLEGVATDLDEALNGKLSQFLDAEEFEAKAASSKVMFDPSGVSNRSIIVGLGDLSKLSEIDWRVAGATASKALLTLPATSVKASKVNLVCPDGAKSRDLLEGFYLGLHTTKQFKGKQTRDKLKTVPLPASLKLVNFGEGSESVASVAQSVARGVILARDMVNAPANVLTPATMASIAQALASETGLEATILEKEQCEEMGMGSFLAVARCSDVPPRLIHLVYRPEGGEAKRKVGIVGKGLTYDAGGYNLKLGAAAMVEKMKFDMGGAAATLGAARAVAALKPADVEVHFIIATCENMVSGNVGALHPGDIITAMDGTTIEVNNTDAEGRLTLADALLYCQQQKVEEIVDIATLTGACMIALGDEISGLWSNSDELATLLQESSKTAGEKVWRMPLEASYFEGMKSDLADMKNTGPSFGGAITAALFLQKFVQKDVKWAHLDIAGPVWSDKAKSLHNGGGTGCMVRTLTEFVRR